MNREGMNGMLKGRTALVTGSTSGIGLGLATAFAAEGCNIVLNGFGDAGEIEKIRAGLATDHGVTVTYSPADMAKGDDIAAMVADAEREFGAIDILCNNAGIQHVAPIDEFPVDKWNAIIAINLTSAFHTIRAALPRMKAKGWGRIINTASAHALVASPFKSAYVAAKHGIAGLTKTVALEVATKGITVNAICPGYTDTDMVAGVPPKVLESIVAQIPIGRLGKAEEIASLVVYLASDSAAFMTGAVLSMNGGQYMANG
jgi:3-hydroxybutyrate dehydrogenase